MTYNYKTRWGRATLMILSTFLSLYLSGGSVSAQSPVLLTDEQEQYLLGLNLEILEDPTGQLTIDQVASPAFDSRFEPSRVYVPNFGLTDSTYWARFRVINQAASTTSWLLEFEYPDMRSLTIYLPVGPDEFRFKTVGYGLPFSNRDYPHYNYVFELPLAPGSEQTIYLRLQNPLVTIPLKIWSADEFSRAFHNETLLMGLFYGVLLIMLAYNIFLYLVLREQSYLYHILFLIGVTGYHGSLHQLIHLYLWPDLIEISEFSIPLFVGLQAVAALRFTNLFLSIKTRLPKLHRLSLICLAGWLLLLLLIPWLGQSILGPMIGLGSVTLPVLWLSGFFTWRQGYRPARYYLLGWSLFLAAWGFVILVRIDLLPSPTFFAERSLQLGVALLSLLLSLALADQINAIKEENAATLSRLELLNQELELRVAARTAELARANRELQTSEANLSALINNTTDMIWSIDRNYIVITVNEPFRELCKQSIPVDIFPGINILELGADDTAKWRDYYDRALQGECFAVEISYPPTVLEVTFNPIITTDQQISGVAVFTRDITRRNQTEARLQQSLEQVKQHFDEARRQRQVAESLREVATILNSSLDKQIVLSKILEQLRNVIHYDTAAIFLAEGDYLRLVDGVNLIHVQIDKQVRITPDTITAVIFEQKEPVIIPDVHREPRWKVWPGGEHIRSWIGVPMLAGQKVIGMLTLDSFQANTYSEQDIHILRIFANQAAIAIENARLFEAQNNALKQVETLYAASLALSSTIDLQQVLKVILSELGKVVPYDSASVQEKRGDYFEIIDGAGFKDLAHVIGIRLHQRKHKFVQKLVETHAPIILRDVTEPPQLKDHPFSEAEIRSWLYVPMLFGNRIIGAISMDKKEVGFYTKKQAHLALAFATQAAIAIENAHLFEREQLQRRMAQQHSRELAQALNHLKTTQQQLIHQEKVASLGMLTSGIAHEIKNPLNFVNNFAAMSVELAQEVRAAIEQQPLRSEARTELTSLLDDLIFNAAKINEQGQRADSIIRNMLLHSRSHTDQRQLVNLNALAVEAINLTYHSFRAKDDRFDLTIETDFDPTLEPLPVIPQDLSRVLVNLIDNAAYAVLAKTAARGNGYTPGITIRTRNLAEKAEISVWDNGIGIPANVREKLFDPFFTTKPAGEGTGLGLSISYDIVTQGHQGVIEVDSAEGEFAEFVIRLPKYLPNSQLNSYWSQDGS